MLSTSLSPAQHEARAKGIGGSDARRIMRGELRDLWLEKTRRRTPDDLSAVFPVQLGILSEPLNLRFLARATGWELYIPGPNETSQHPLLPFMLCHPDALVPDLGIVVDCKHTNQFSNEGKLREEYYWQLVHNIACMHGSGNYNTGVISPIYGNQHGAPVYIRPSIEDFDQLMAAEAAFWWYVENDVEPEDAGTTPARPEPVRVVDMCADGSNYAGLWSAHALVWADDHAAAKRFAKAEKELKELMPEDAAAAYGQGLIITRDKAGKRKVQDLTAKLADKYGIALEEEPVQ